MTVDIDEDQVKCLVMCFLSWKKVCCQEVSICFVNKTMIAKLHGDYFQDATPTDCISFPIDAPQDKSNGYKVLGEVFVCPEIAFEYASTHHLSPLKELSLCIVHGLLHLLGYDDRNVKNQVIMYKEERLAISYLQKKGVLLHA